MINDFGDLAWRGEDAARWSRQRAPRWAEEGWSAPALLYLFAALLIALGTAPLHHAGWTGASALGLLPLLALWLTRLPELVLLGAPALLALTALAARDGNAAAWAPYAAAPVLSFLWTAACRRLVARRRQRQAAERAARLWRRIPDGLGPLRRGALPIVLGLLLCGTAALTVRGPGTAPERQFLTGLLAVPGLALLTRGCASRLRARALRHKPVPVLLVRLRQDAAGTTRTTTVFAGDDSARGGALFHCSLYPRDPSDRAALLFGAPRPAGELVLVTAGGAGSTARSVSVPSRIRPQPKPSPRHPTGKDVARTAAAMRPTSEPLRWGPNRGSRLAGALTALGGLAVVAVATETVAHQIPASRALGLLFLPLWWGVLTAAQLLNWRVTADRDGLWLSDSFGVPRLLPWEQLHAVHLTGTGPLRIVRRTPDGRTKEWHSGDTGSQALARRLQVHEGLDHVAAALLALRGHPEIRPTTAASRFGRGTFPLVPVLLLANGALAELLHSR